MLAATRDRSIGLPRGRRKIATLIVGVLCAAVLAACGGTSSSESSPSSTDTLRIALPGWTPESFDLATNCSSPIFDVAYEPLIRISPTGGYEPGIAESWEYSENNTVFTMQIRDGVKFSDGTDLTVESVVETLNYYKSTPGLNSGFWEPLTIDAAGENTVQITSKEPFRGTESLLSSSQCNNGIIISEAGLENPENLKTDMHGAGAYQYVPEESEPGDHYTFTPNPHYFDKSRQHWKKIVMRVIGDPNTAFNALATGQVDVNMTGGDQFVGQAQQMGFDVTQAAPYGAGIFVWDRGGKLSEPLADVRVRQAMAYALDRDKLAELGGPETEPLGQIIHPDMMGWGPNLGSEYTYDLAKARQLMAEAGYPDGFSVTMLVNTDDLDAKDILMAAVQQLKSIGVDIKLKSAPETTFFSDILSKQYPLGAVSWALLGDAVYESFRLYKMPYAMPLTPFESADPDLEEAYQALQTADESTVEAAAQEFNEVMTAKAWVIPITSSPLYVYSKGVEIGESSPVGYFNIPSWAPKS